jgi:hypothetical protein
MAGMFTVCRKSNGPSRLAAIIFLVAVIGGPVHAETLKILCEDAGEKAPAKLTLTYNGGASGTLDVQAPFGEMSLPATKEEREDIEDGEKITATGIRAFGPATVTMPDKAAIEACVKGKLRPEEFQHEDIVATVLSPCAQAASPSKEPIAIKATVEIGIYDPPSADVELTRAFLQPSTLPGGAIKIETMPANCNVGN